MKPKNLLVLALILTVLVGLVVYKKTTHTAPSIMQQTGLIKLLPNDLSKADIVKLELYAGEKPDDKVTLAYDSEADKWRVMSHFNSPAKKEVIDKYLDAVLKLKGEPRSLGSTDADLEQYGLTDAKAFHVTGFKKDGNGPLFHFLIGKSPAYKTIFIRRDGAKEIFVEETDLRQQAGVYAAPKMPGKAEEKEAAPQKPEANIWLDKDIVKVDTAKITKIALTLPDKSLVFERKEKPKPAEPASSTVTPPAPATMPAPAAAGSSEEEAPITTISPESLNMAMPGGASAPGAASTPVTPSNYEWVLASGGPGGAFKQKGLDSLLQRISPLTAIDIVDPSKKADWGLDPAQYVCVVSVEGQPDIRIEGGRPSPGGDGYIRIAGAKEDIVYKVNQYTFEQLFPKGTELFDMAGLSLDKKTIDSVNVTQPEGNFALAKKGEALDVLAPTADLKSQTTTVDTLANALAGWKPVDYADTVPELGEPVRVIKFTADGKMHSLKVFGKSKHIDGAYCRLDDGNAVYVISRADLDRIFVAPKNLFELRLYDSLDIAGVAEMDVKNAQNAYTLTKKNDAWSITIDGTMSGAKMDEVNNLASEVSGLQAAEVLFGQADLSSPAEASLIVKRSDGSTISMSFGPEKDGMNELKISGKNECFKIEHAKMLAMFPLVDMLKAEEKTTEAKPVEVTPAAPVETKPVEVTPAAPAEAKPVEAAPAAPTEAKPAEVDPAAPAEAKPVEAAPAAPAETKPAEAAPAQPQQ